MRPINLEGKNLNSWTVLSMCGVDKHKKRQWDCVCVCGNHGKVSTGDLMSGKSSNCGCVKVLNLKKRVTTHGYTKNWNIPKEYKSWAEAKRRCLDDSRPAWKDYGGRGISMCEAWQNSFEEFFLHMGNCPKGKSLDRINNEGNYEPGNCRWATRSEQGNNTRRTRWIDFNGKTKTLSGWAEWLGVKIGVISYRLDIVGLSIEDAMSDIVSKHKLKNTP